MHVHIQKLVTCTLCAGRSLDMDSVESVPITNSPAGIHAMPCGAAEGGAGVVGGKWGK